MTARHIKLPAPRRVHYALLLVAMAVFAVYGSLVPLDYHRLPWDQAVAKFRRISWLELGVVHRADWVANILLFVPLGFLGLAVGEADCRPGWRTVLLWPISLAVWSALSLAIEFTQLWFPPRTVSLNDLIAETIGAALGSLLWFAAGQRGTDWFRRFTAASAGEGLAAIVLPAYLVFLAITHLMPLDLSLSPGELWDKYQAGKILLVPLTMPHNNPLEMVTKYAWNAVFFLPVGWLLAHVPAWSFGGRQSRWFAATVGAAVCGTIELAQLFVLTRFTDVTDVLLGTLLVVLGWELAARFSPVARTAHGALTAHGASGGASPGLFARSGSGARAAWGPALAWLAAVLLWWTVIAYVSWRPLAFRLDPRDVAQRLERFSLIPFYDYYRQSEFKSFDNVLRRLIVFAPLGLGAALAWRSLGRPPAAWWLWPLGMVQAGVIEAAQFFLPGKVPSTTDFVLGSAGAGLGLYLAGKLFPVRHPTAAGRAVPVTRA